MCTGSGCPRNTAHLLTVSVCVREEHSQTAIIISWLTEALKGNRGLCCHLQRFIIMHDLSIYLIEHLPSVKLHLLTSASPVFHSSFCFPRPIVLPHLFLFSTLMTSVLLRVCSNGCLYFCPQSQVLWIHSKNPYISAGKLHSNEG